MESIIGIYDTHEYALKALAALKENNFPMKQVSLIGKAEVIEDHVHIKSYNKAKNAPVLLGTGGGALIGLLTGIGVFAIPGFGFLYGAGAIIGTLAGFDVGLVAGGIGSLLTSLGLKEAHNTKIQEHLEKGKYALMIHGSEEEINKAEQILEEEGNHFELIR